MLTESEYARFNGKIFDNPILKFPRRVKLLVHQKSHQAVALKVVDKSRHKDAAECVKREEMLQKVAVHPNIIRFFGRRDDGDKVYIFLEYAAGGELFNRIGI